MIALEAFSKETLWRRQSRWSEGTGKACKGKFWLAPIHWRLDQYLESPS